MSKHARCSGCGRLIGTEYVVDRGPVVGPLLYEPPSGLRANTEFSAVFENNAEMKEKGVASAALHFCECGQLLAASAVSSDPQKESHVWPENLYDVDDISDVLTDEEKEELV